MPAICRARRRSAKSSRRLSCRIRRTCLRSCSRHLWSPLLRVGGAEWGCSLPERQTEAAMDLQLKARVVMITGPAKGMGAAITKAFAAEGSRLALVGRDVAAVEPVAKE